ncbi:beta-ketoacyl-[acyl-carrier-protein] synthase family protein [Geminisphaera colitermitum]|uniref:beta-ketoacyl-[acyl-carrier-protein] synthase family protein n=1 Tax=Geminisphaera colitermitum TaxID=1148786 RepID=UPI0005BE844C|nr:beta-ketoacyl-[acyl-carrier-protein] synthase family protein [Geminisphaera colitermitum]
MIHIQAAALINPLGATPAAILDALSTDAPPPGMTTSTRWLANGAACRVGEAPGPLPEIPPELAAHDTRNNRLLLAALAQIRPALDALLARHSPGRIAVILGSSTSGILEGELAVRHHHEHGTLPSAYRYAQQEPGDPARFLAAHLGLTGPAYTISTACSSSARALLSARRLLRAGIVDAVIAGGADSLCQLTLNGFNSLQALSLSPGGTKPFAADRDGITIGEAAALLLLAREPGDRPGTLLLGAGESSDAWHMSAPRPDGTGAEAAMLDALRDAGIDPARAHETIGYINLHGTGTPLNDSMETAAVYRLFGDRIPCGSTKHLTGHTLGACGATEAALCHHLILSPRATLPRQQLAPAERDATLPPVDLVTRPGRPLSPRAILSNSFAFGGNNAALILGPA